MNHLVLKGLVGLYLGLIPAACMSSDGSRADGEWEAVVDTVEGTVVVRTISGSVWNDTASLEPEISIGMLEGPDEYLIGNPRSIALVLLNYGTAPWDWIFGLARIDPTKGILDTVPAPTWDYEPPQITASCENSSSSDNVPFSPDDWWSFSPLGYMIGGVSTDYRIDLYRASRPVLRIEREWTPIAVKPEEAEEQRRAKTDNMQRQYSGWKWNGPAVPHIKPPFTGLFASEEGNIWVQLSQEGYATMTEAEARAEEHRTNRPQPRFTEPAAFDVFLHDGTFLGHVKTPRSFRTRPEPIVRGDTVWAVTRDELDVARVVRFRIARSH